MVSKSPSTARSRLVSALSTEILSKDKPAAYPIASEHQLCVRFNVSRVTVRLALSDLENRGLIYRKHGKGTFAHGSTTRAHRAMGILMRLPQAAEHRPVAEMVRGVQSEMASSRSAVMLISTPPEEWRSEMASMLAGVIVMPQEVTQRDLDILKDRNLPFLIFTESGLTGPTILVGQAKAARELTERILKLGHRRIALFSGYDASLDATKRRGIHEALRAAGIDPCTIPEISAQGDESEVFPLVRQILKLDPRPTAVIAFDDTMASLLSGVARRHENIKVPGELSIVSFHGWPYLKFLEPTLTTANFQFFNAGRSGAAAINRAALTGEPLTDIRFEPSYQAGQTLGPVPGGKGRRAAAR